MGIGATQRETSPDTLGAVEVLLPDPGALVFRLDQPIVITIDGPPPFGEGGQKVWMGPHTLKQK